MLKKLVLCKLTYNYFFHNPIWLGFTKCCFLSWGVTTTPYKLTESCLLHQLISQVASALHRRLLNWREELQFSTKSMKMRHSFTRLPSHWQKISALARRQQSRGLDPGDCKIIIDPLTTLWLLKMLVILVPSRTEPGLFYTVEHLSSGDLSLKESGITPEGTMGYLIRSCTQKSLLGIADECGGLPLILENRFQVLETGSGFQLCSRFFLPGITLWQSRRPPHRGQQAQRHHPALAQLPANQLLFPVTVVKSSILIALPWIVKFTNDPILVHNHWT